MRKKIVIVDYGSGNILSAKQSFLKASNDNNLNADIFISNNPKDIETSSHVVLPGQGAFKSCMEGLKNIPGMIESLKKNIITNIFSSENSNFAEMNNNNFKKSMNVLLNDIDYIYRTEDINHLITKIISIFNMPNVLFQKFQISTTNYFKKNDENLSIINKYNQYDVKIYSELNKKKIFKKAHTNLIRKPPDMFFVLSASIKFNDKFTALMRPNQFDELKQFMYNNKFNIIKN